MKPNDLLAGTALVFALTACHTAPEDALAQSGHSVEGTVHICSSCHGLTGRSVSPNFPILAGQQKEYLEVQLHAFREQTRADPHAHTYMWGMAKHLDDPTIEGVAAYFAGQPVVAGPGGGVNKLGALLYAEGAEAREIPACVGCHGEKAEGQGAIPRLAGQHAGYLAEQLGHFRSNARSNETMHMNALNLTDAEIAALAEYLSSL
jgi:cytochrome c553